MKNIVILQNTEIGSTLALSVYLAGFIKNLKYSKYNISLIIAENLMDTNIEYLDIFKTNTSLYGVFSNFKYTYRSFKLLKKLNKKQKIDVLHCFYPNSSLLSAVLYKLLVNKNVKIIYDIRSPWIEMVFEKNHINSLINNLLKLVMHYEEKVLTRFADYYIFISNGLKRYYSRKYRLNVSKSSVIPTSVDTNLFKSKKSNLKKELGFNKNEIIIGHIGGMNHNRKLDVFLKIFKNALEKNDDLRLVFIGDGEAKKMLMSKTEIFNLTKYVKFLNNVSHEKIPEYISGFDYGLCYLPKIFVFRYSVPIKILEYLACGITPLITENNVDEIYNKNSIIIRDGIFRLKKVKIMKKSFYEYYSWKSNIKNYEKIYGGL